MKRVCVVITARPSYSRVKSALTALDARKDVHLFIMATASAKLRRFGNVLEQIQADFPKAWMEGPSTVVEGDGNEESVVSTGLLTIQLGNHFAMMKPDVVVTIADRHETLATAIAASYQNIPLCHIQGGEVSGSIDDKVRNAVTQLADIHCVATQQAALNVAQKVGALNAYDTAIEGPIHVTGCPSIDLAAEAMKLGPLPGHDVVVLQHPVTTEVDQAGAQMRETIKALDGMDVQWFWPGEDAGSEAMSKELRLAGKKPIRNMEPLAFLRTLLGSGCLVGNSSVGIRECSFLGVPVINIGTRQQGREHAINVFHVKQHEAKSIRGTVQRQKGERFGSSKLYGDGHAGERIAAILAGAEKEAVA